MATPLARWLAPTPDQPPWCLGSVELAPLAEGPALELHLERFDDAGPGLGFVKRPYARGCV